MATIRINFSAPSPAPDSYTIAYRIVGSGVPYTTVNRTGAPPFDITGLADDQNWEGYVVANCSGGGVSAAVTFSVNDAAPVANLYTIKNQYTTMGVVSWTRYDGTRMQQSVAVGAQFNICARVGSVQVDQGSIQVINTNTGCTY